MCTSTVAAADALPAQPEMAIGDSTVDRSGICTSVPLLAVQPAGLGDGDGVGVGPAPRLMVQESMRPTSAGAASWTRSFQVPLPGSDDRLVVYVWSMLSLLPPA